MAISVPWPKPVGWAEEECAQERTVKWNGLLSLYSTSLLDVTGEDSIGKGRFYQVLNAEVPIIVAHIFVKNIHFLMNFIFSE